MVILDEVRSNKVAKKKFKEQKNSRRNGAGRPFGIEDGELFNSRDHLVCLLENSWGVVGWELQRIKAAGDVRNALESWRHEHESHYAVLALLRASEIPATAQELNSMRRQRTKLNQSARKANQFKGECRERLERTDRALSAQLSKSEARQIQAQRVKDAKALADAEEELSRLHTQLQNLETSLQDGEAYFARQELLRFCKSRRYSVKPLNAANAMAGLPYIGWRQSAKRCSRVECLQAGSLDYEIFRTLRRIVNSCPHVEYLTNHTDNWLRGKRMTPVDPISHMQQDWYYLRRAIQAALKERPLHSKKLPFLIIAEYQQRTSHPSPADYVLAQGERIIP